MGCPSGDDGPVPLRPPKYHIDSVRFYELMHSMDYDKLAQVVVASAKTSGTVPTSQNAPQKPYSSVSDWAVAELDKAYEYGFITQKIKDKMNAAITREEFAEISVKLYEKLTGITAECVTDPFSDTKNPEVIKAADLGIVNGVGGGRFASQNLVTRQEISVMLNRVIEMCRPQVDFSTDSVAPFSDEQKIASWALQSMRMMSQYGIMQGVGNRTVNPLGNTTRQEAVLLVVRTYETFNETGHPYALPG